jgi:uncharacterized protein YndB with AHSA1/START domain
MTQQQQKKTAMITKILIGLAAIIVLFLLVVALRPADFRVERSATLAASPAALFEQVNSHRKFAVWNPFMKLDPNVKNTFSGPEAGVGAVCSWDGNKNIGAGSATIVESRPNELVRLRMDWKRPMEGTSTVDFTFKPQGDKTVVTWAMYGRNNFMGKLVSLFIDCDQMAGPQFEQGLADLGKVVAAAPVAKEGPAGPSAVAVRKE